MCGSFLNLNKMKYFQITRANILFTIEHRKHNKCLNGEILHFYLLNELISIWCLLQVSKKLAQGQQMAENARHFEKILLGEHLATDEVNWLQVCNMISYKSDVLERQSLRKDGQRLSILWKCVKWLWNTLKTMFLNVKLQRLYKSHHLQCIRSSKDSKNLEKFLCVRDKTEDLYWMPVVFRPSDNTV